jgi:outer membrane protein assembly factor BamD
MLSRIVRRISPALLGLALAACASSPRYQGMTADQLHALAQEEYARGDDGKAAEALETLLVTFPGYAQAAEAQMLLAEAYFRDGKHVTAQAEYRRFLDRYPTHGRAAEAALGMCRSAGALSPITQRDQTFTEQAVQICGETARSYAGTPEGEEAAEVAEAMREKLARKTFETGEYYLRRGFHHPAIVYFDLVLESYASTSFAPRALVGTMEAYEALGYEDEVEAARERLLTSYPDSPEARQVAGRDRNGTATRLGSGG